jgi:hypothetical protein
MADVQPNAVDAALKGPDTPFVPNPDIMPASEIDKLDPIEKQKQLEEQQVKLRNLPHKIRKAIVGAIAAYNFSHMFMSAESRGKDIQRALIEISQYHPSVLAKLNLDGALVSVGNWLGNAPMGFANVTSRAATEVGRVTGVNSAVSSAANTTRRVLGNLTSPFSRRTAPASGGKRRKSLRKRRRA